VTISYSIYRGNPLVSVRSNRTSMDNGWLQRAILNFRLAESTVQDGQTTNRSG